MNIEQYKGMLLESKLEAYFKLQMNVENIDSLNDYEKKELSEILSELKSEDTMEIVLKHSGLLTNYVSPKVIKLFNDIKVSNNELREMSN
jgi:hypothetical protein